MGEIDDKDLVHVNYENSLKKTCFTPSLKILSTTHRSVWHNKTIGIHIPVINIHKSYLFPREWRDDVLGIVNSWLAEMIMI